MDALSLTAVVGLGLQAAGLVWIAGKSAERSAENQKRIGEEVKEREAEVLRLSNWLLKNEVESKERAKLNADKIDQTETRLLAHVGAGGEDPDGELEVGVAGGEAAGSDPVVDSYDAEFVFFRGRRIVGQQRKGNIHGLLGYSQVGKP